MEEKEIEEAFNLAAAKHNEGDLEQAEHIYRNILSVDGRHIASNHNLGILLASTGGHAETLSVFGQVFDFKPF